MSSTSRDQYNFEFWQGTTVRKRAYRQYSSGSLSGSAFDWTGHTLLAAAKADPNQTTPDFHFSCSFSGTPTDGVVYINLPASSSLNLTATKYYFDFLDTYPDGTKILWIPGVATIKKLVSTS